MKIRVIKLRDPNDVGVLNLTKAFAVRKKVNENGFALVVYYPGAAAAMTFPQAAFKFEFVEITMDGVVHYSPTDIDAIVTTFTALA